MSPKPREEGRTGLTTLEEVSREREREWNRSIECTKHTLWDYRSPACTGESRGSTRIDWGSMYRLATNSVAMPPHQSHGRSTVNDIARSRLKRRLGGGA